MQAVAPERDLVAEICSPACLESRVEEYPVSMKKAVRAHRLPAEQELEECLAVRPMAQWVQAERASLWKEQSFDSGFAAAACQE